MTENRLHHHRTVAPTTRRAFLAGAATAALASMAGAAVPPAPPPRIVVFGDSLTEGYGLGPEQALVAQLQDWLDSRDLPAVMVNHGLSGDTTFGGRVRIHWVLRQNADAVIVELGGNDFLAGLALSDTEKNLDSIILRAKRGGRPVLLVGIVPPQRVLRVPRADVIAMWTRLAERHQVLLLPDLYGPLWQFPESEWPRFLQEDQTHLSPEGVRLVVDGELGPKTAELLAAIQRSGRADKTRNQTPDAEKPR